MAKFFVTHSFCLSKFLRGGCSGIRDGTADWFFSGFDSGIYHGPDQIDFPKAAKKRVKKRRHFLIENFYQKAPRFFLSLILFLRTISHESPRAAPAKISLRCSYGS